MDVAPPAFAVVVVVVVLCFVVLEVSPAKMVVTAR